MNVTISVTIVQYDYSTTCEQANDMNLDNISSLGLTAGGGFFRHSHRLCAKESSEASCNSSRIILY